MWVLLGQENLLKNARKVLSNLGSDGDTLNGVKNTFYYEKEVVKVPDGRRVYSISSRRKEAIIMKVWLTTIIWLEVCKESEQCPLLFIGTKSNCFFFLYEKKNYFWWVNRFKDIHMYICDRLTAHEYPNYIWTLERTRFKFYFLLLHMRLMLFNHHFFYKDCHNLAEGEAICLGGGELNLSRCYKNKINL